MLACYDVDVGEPRLAGLGVAAVLAAVDGRRVLHHEGRHELRKGRGRRRSSRKAALAAVGGRRRRFSPEAENEEGENELAHLVTFVRDMT